MSDSKRKTIKIIENITIEKLWHGGIWIATHTDGRKILIKWWPLPKSIVDIRVIKSKSDYIQWHITKIHFISEEYSDWQILCPHYMYSPLDQKNMQDGILPTEIRPPQKTGCGGCKWQIVNYNKQLIIKKQLVVESFDIINKKNKIYIIDDLSSDRRSEFRDIYLEAAKNELTAFWPIDINYQQAYEATDLHWIKKFNNPNRHYVFLMDNDNIIGMMICGPTLDTKWQNTDIWWIWSVYIIESHRNKWYAKTLMDNCIYHMYYKLWIIKTTLQVSKTQAAAIKFYKWYGFDVVQEISNSDEWYLFEWYEMQYIFDPLNSNTYNLQKDDDDIYLGEENHQKNIKSDNNTYINILNPVPSPKIRWYRNKIEFSFGKYISEGQRLSEWSIGFHKQWEFAKIVDIDVCYLVDNIANNIYTYAKNLLMQTGYDVYDQKFHKWVFRHLMIRQWQNTWEFMMVLIVSDKFTSSPNDLLRLKDTFKNDPFLKSNITTMIVGINNWLADIMFLPDTVLDVLRWEWYIYETLNILDQSLKFKISPQSFFQTNTSGAEVLFETSINILSHKLSNKKGLIIDLYCGAGTIGLSLLAWNICQNIIWVDVVESSIHDANTNALQNNMSATSKFYCGKAEDIVKNLKNISELTAIVIDPPREWLHIDVLDFLINTKKTYDFKLLYISCNPVTMARDINILLTCFEVSEIQPMDMFPHTHHIECIALLS